jgi:hypothetical protein
MIRAPFDVQIAAFWTRRQRLTMPRRGVFSRPKAAQGCKRFDSSRTYEHFPSRKRVAQKMCPTKLKISR